MSRLTCAQCENMLLDAADDLLLAEEQTQFDLHLTECAACAKMFADVKRGGAWMEMLKAEPPVPPEGMVDRILARTSGDAQLAGAVAANVAHAQSIFGHSQAKVLPFRAIEKRTPWAHLAHTVMQPRFAMTAAMAFFSIALTLNIAGVRLSALEASDLKPTNLRKSFWSVNGKVVRYYDNLRVVYELESRVREMQRESDAAPAPAPQRGVIDNGQPGGTQNDEPSRKPPSGQPRSSVPRRRHHDGPDSSWDGDHGAPRFSTVSSRHMLKAAVEMRREEGARA